jgi:hypothetical protein
MKKYSMQISLLVLGSVAILLGYFSIITHSVEFLLASFLIMVLASMSLVRYDTGAAGYGMILISLNYYFVTFVDSSMVVVCLPSISKESLEQVLDTLRQFMLVFGASIGANLIAYKLTKWHEQEKTVARD